MAGFYDAISYGCLSVESRYWQCSFGFESCYVGRRTLSEKKSSVKNLNKIFLLYLFYLFVIIINLLGFYYAVFSICSEGFTSSRLFSLECPFFCIGFVILSACSLLQSEEKRKLRQELNDSLGFSLHLLENELNKMLDEKKSREKESVIENIKIEKPEIKNAVQYIQLQEETEVNEKK